MKLFVYKQLVSKDCLFFLAMSCVVAFAIFLRTYRFMDTVTFHGDQASDLFIARDIVELGILPRVGPMLSVKHFSTPPTYYYILAVYYFFFRTPQGVTFVFTIMNLVAMYFMVRIATMLYDRVAGLIMGVLFATSILMIGESRQMWQVYPTTIGITGSLLLLLSAKKNKSVLLYCSSILLYMMTFSVYVSPLLLLPYYIYSSVEFALSKWKKSVLFILSLLFLIMIASFYIFFGRYLLFEYEHGFPTFSTLYTSEFGAPKTLSQAVLIYNQYLSDLLGNFFASSSDNRVFQIVFEICIIASCVLPGIYMRHKTGALKEKFLNAEKFLGLPFLFLGLLIMLFFQKSLYTYRIFVFIPFLFIQVTSLIWFAWKLGNRVLLAVAVVVLSAYLYGNLQRVQYVFQSIGQDEVYLAETIASKIGLDASRNNISRSQMAVDVSSNYFIFPFLYYLRDFAKYSLPMSATGNDIDRSMLGHHNAKFVYYICVRDYALTYDFSSCVKEYLSDKPFYTISSVPYAGLNASLIKLVRIPTGN